MSATHDQLLAEAHTLLAADRLSEAAGLIADARARARGAPELARAIDSLGALQARRNELRSALDCHLFAALLAREDRADWDGDIAPASPIPEASASSAHPALEASLLANAGALAQIGDAPAVAERALCRAAALTADDSHALASEVAHNLGVFLMNVGRPVEALAHLRRAAAIDRALDSPASLLGDLVRLASALRRTGEAERRDEALAALSEARSLARSPIASAEVALEESSLRFAAGEVLEAMQSSREAVDLLEDQQESPEIARQLSRAYLSLAIYARRLKRRKAALESLDRADDAARQAKNAALGAIILRERKRWAEA